VADQPTYNDFMLIAANAVAGVEGGRITPEAVLTPGSDVNILLSAAALMAERCITDSARIEANSRIDTAEGVGLDQIGFDEPYGVPRIQAAPATVTLALTRASYSAGSGTIAQGTRLKLGGVPFRTLFAVSFSATALEAEVYAQAEATGPGGNVAEGTSGTWTDQPFDGSIAIEAAENAAGGTDRETDASYRERLRAAPREARRGTLSAIEFGALTVPGVAFATATDVLQASGLPALQVSLVVSDAAGNSSGAMLYLVGLALGEYRCGGVPTFVNGGTAEFVDVVVALTFLATVDSLAAAQAAVQRIVAYVNGLGPGQTLVTSSIAAAALGSSVGATGVVSCDVVSPAGNLQPSSPTGVIRTTTARVTTA